MDVLLTLLGAAGLNFIMGIAGSDDIMLNYQTTSFHDALYLRQLLGKTTSPEFAAWLQQMNIMQQHGQQIQLNPALPQAFQAALGF